MTAEDRGQAGSPRLSVVLGTLDRLDQLRRCVASIRRETRTAHVVYVTDAGSTDGTVEYLTGVASESVRPLLVGRRLGQARAYNDVFAMLDTPYVAWLSDDNEVVDGGLDTAVRILDSRPQVGMVGLKTRDVQGPFVKAPYIGGISSIGILNVNQGVLRTDLLKAVGGFSEVFRDYGIDPDLTAKVLYSGREVVYTRAVALHHYRNWSTERDSPEYQAQLVRTRRAQALYDRKYEHLARGAWLWNGRRTLWWLLARALGRRYSLDSPRRVLGLVTRDWHNVVKGRYISLLDPLRTAGREYHLVQRCPRLRRPGHLPEDPRVSEDGAGTVGTGAG